MKLNFATNHELFTVREMNWLGKLNGELLGLMVVDGFDAFVTIDKNLHQQQNLARFQIRLFILNAPTNKLDTLEPYIQRLAKALDRSVTEQVSVIDLDQPF